MEFVPIVSLDLGELSSADEDERNSMSLPNFGNTSPRGGVSKVPSTQFKNIAPLVSDESSGLCARRNEAGEETNNGFDIVKSSLSPPGLATSEFERSTNFTEYDLIQSESAPQSPISQHIASGRYEMLEWINSFLDMDLQSLEECCSGLVYCQLLDALKPGIVCTSELILNPTSDDEKIHNLRLFHKALAITYFSIDLPLRRLAAGSYKETWELLLWIRKMFKRDYSGDIYNAKEKRQIHLFRRKTAANSTVNARPEFMKLKPLAMSQDSAILSRPVDMVINPEDGSFYVCDQELNAVLCLKLKGNKFEAERLISSTGSLHGGASEALLSSPSSLGLSADGKYLFISDTANHTIRQLSLVTRRLTTLVDRRQNEPKFSYPGALCSCPCKFCCNFEYPGNPLVLVADRASIYRLSWIGRYNVRASKRRARPVLVAGQSKVQGLADGKLPGGKLNKPSSITCIGNGRFVIADTANHVLRLLDLKTQQVSTLNGENGLKLRGKQAQPVSFIFPTGTAFDGIGNLFVVDMSGAIRKIEMRTGRVSTIYFDDENKLLFPSGLKCRRAPDRSRTTLYIFDEDCGKSFELSERVPVIRRQPSKDTSRSTVKISSPQMTIIFLLRRLACFADGETLLLVSSAIKILFESTMNGERTNNVTKVVNTAEARKMMFDLNMPHKVIKLQHGVDKASIKNALRLMKKLPSLREIRELQKWIQRLYH